MVLNRDLPFSANRIVLVEIGDFTSLRRLFAFLKLGERYRDLTRICPEPLRYTVIPSGKKP
jgi:hypothetical protein